MRLVMLSGETQRGPAYQPVVETMCKISREGGKRKRIIITVKMSWRSQRSLLLFAPADANCYNDASWQKRKC